MPRPPSGKPRKVFFRRHTNWSPKMEVLVDQAAQLIREKRLYFPYNTERDNQTNVAGVIQGVMVLASEALAQTPREQWMTFWDQFEAIPPTKEVRGIHIDEQALTAFNSIESHLKQLSRPKTAKMGRPSRYPLVITVSLLWFIHHNQ